MTGLNGMGFVAALVDGFDGAGGYTDPLIFAIPVALVVIVIVIVISASKINSQQTRIRNEDRLLDTLERIRLENMETTPAGIGEEEDSSPEDPNDMSLFMGGLTGDGNTLTQSPITELAREDAQFIAEVEQSTPGNEQARGDSGSGDAGEASPVVPDQDQDDDEAFDSEVEPEKPPSAVCDPDGLCFIPLPSQSVDEARYIARAKRDGSYVAGVTEEEAAEKFGHKEEPGDTGDTEDTESTEDTEKLGNTGDTAEPGDTKGSGVLAALNETVDKPGNPAEKPDSSVEEPGNSAEVAEPAEPAVETAVSSAEKSAEKPEDITDEEPLDKPESKTSRLRRLKERLAGTGKFGRAILGVLSRAELADGDWQDLEDELLSADFGVEATTEIIDKLKVKQKVAGTKDAKEVRRMAKRLIGDFLDRHADRELNLNVPAGSEGSTVGILMVGVNGGGKTTTVGKLARFLVANRKSVVLGAADTFRAAAGEQLETWGSRVGVPVVRSHKDKADPASVAFDAAKAGRENGADVVLIDTAGRLQNKSGLMDELVKIKRVAEKQVPITEVLLVIDATTGQNALSQAKVFAEAVGVTGIVLTKLDGSAKGGVIIPLQRELGIPVKLVGLGEGPDDLAPFVPADFSDALLNA